MTKLFPYEKNYRQAAQVTTFKFTVKEMKGKKVLVQKADELLFQPPGDKFCCRSKTSITDNMKIVMIMFLVLTPIIKWILFAELLITKSLQPRL